MSRLSAPSDPDALMTQVELIHEKGRIEQWVRFGTPVSEQRIDRRRRVLGFGPGSVFAVNRWAANDYGTVLSRFEILRALPPGEACQTLPYLRPGAELLLAIHGWPKVERLLQMIDAIEALGIDASHVAPDHWRHLHNRLSVGLPAHRYTRLQHRAWLKRKALGR
jgi:hypothetical protein